jgi:hypothetical protein
MTAGDDDEGPGRRGLLVALAVIVVLVLAGWWISGALHRGAAVQDCVMQGRSNCAPIR